MLICVLVCYRKYHIQGTDYSSFYFPSPSDPTADPICLNNPNNPNNSDNRDPESLPNSPSNPDNPDSPDSPDNIVDEEICLYLGYPLTALHDESFCYIKNCPYLSKEIFCNSLQSSMVNIRVIIRVDITSGLSGLSGLRIYDGYFTSYSTMLALITLIALIYTFYYKP